MVQKVIARKELRQFGCIVGGVFSAIGLWPLIARTDLSRFWALAIGVILILLGGFFPRSLTRIYRGWMAVGHALGWINTRVILGLLYYLVITPMGLIMRLLGKDPLRRRFSGDLPSYRVNSVKRDPSSHMRNLF
ncbi:MAG: SxtJ family membrane protein [Desulfurivibrionaceae bacterium]